MKSRISKTAGAGLMALGLAALLLTTSSSSLLASSNNSDPLTGTWTIQVTLRDCTTGAPVGPPINSLVTFHEGGTLSESAGGLGFAIGQRSPGHGIWTKERHHLYHQKFIALINFDTPANLPGMPGFDPTKPVSPGFFAGWQTVTHTLELTDDDHAASEGTNALYKADGTVYRTGCSTAVGERFK